MSQPRGSDRDRRMGDWLLRRAVERGDPKDMAKASILAGRPSDGPFIIRGHKNGDDRYIMGWASGGPMMQVCGAPAKAKAFSTRERAQAWLDDPNQSVLKHYEPLVIIPLAGAPALVPRWKREMQEAEKDGK